MGQRVVLTIERLVAGGLGLSRYEGRIVFLPGVLPGEEVEVAILASRSDYLRAKPVYILKPHAERRTPPCPLFLVCGGCQLMHAAYPIQPDLKLKAGLERLAGVFKREIIIKPSPFSLFYRDRVRLHLARVGDRLALGFFAAGSKRLVPIDFCHQLHPRLNLLLPALTEWMTGLAGRNDSSLGLSVQMGTPAEGVLAVMEFGARPVAGTIKAALAGPETGEQVKVFLKINGQVRPKPRPEDAVTVLSLSDRGLRLSALPGAFTQVNPAVNRLLVMDVLNLAQEMKPKRALDLYAGIGNFTLPLAVAADNVCAVEVEPAALASARLNIRQGGLDQVTLLRAEAVAAAEGLADHGERFELVVLDPPRAGAKGLATQVARLKAVQVLYISCHPAAMTRDLAEFQSLGYYPSEITAYDMFPQTAHLEVLAHLIRC
ncbi:MAG: class I SAM-dependent RNA methyltransferase [Thermodesulfobacteriota bacterium]